MFPNDFKELLFAFNSQKVKYLVIGGYAVIVHSQPRATKDLDVLIGPGIENADSAYAALAEFGAPLEGLTPADLIEPGTFFRMGTPPLMVDILPGTKEVDFDRLGIGEMDIVVGDEQIPIISSEDLIQSKLAVGRPMDLMDVAAIREAQQSAEPKHTTPFMPQENQIEQEPDQEQENEQERER
jgi:hypothetical protein